ncbi:MAG TPA: hypothetical protein VEX67_08270 [Solirubrobacteraceae bacterium]|nr:hypothetical protein [Solirubrobacteraceae bacterium]
MKRLFLLTVFVALLAPASASAATYVFNIPQLVEKPLVAVKKTTKLPVLLPSRMTTEQRRLFSEGRGRANRYEFEIGAVKDCGTATACYVAGFRARKGGKPSATRKVQLANDRTGYYRPTSCGASCAAPSIEWVQGGVLYEVEAKLGTQKTERKVLTRLANSAIRNGKR